MMKQTAPGHPGAVNDPGRLTPTAQLIDAPGATRLGNRAVNVRQLRSELSLSKATVKADNTKPTGIFHSRPKELAMDDTTTALFIGGRDSSTPDHSRTRRGQRGLPSVATT